MRAAAAMGVRTRARAAAESAAGPPSKRRKVKGVELKKLGKGRRIVAAARRRPVSSPANSSGSKRGGRISRCSSNASCDAREEAELRSGSVKSGGGSDTAVCYLECSRERRRETTSTSTGDQSGDLESTAATRSGAAVAMPAPSEIEEFLAAAESAEKRRFSDKYNFDVDRDIPLDGRYEWVRLGA